MYMKRFLACLLVLVLGFSLLSACASSGETVESAAPTEAETGSATEAPAAAETQPASEETPSAEDGEMTLPLVDEEEIFTWWCMFNSTATDGRGDCLAWEETARRTGITVEFSCAVEDNAAMQMTLMATSGDMTEFVSGIAEYFDAGVPAALDAGLATDITEAVQEYCPNYWNIIAADEELMRQNLNDDGILWSLRLIKQDNPVVPVVGTISRQDLFDKYDLETPVTFADWDHVFATWQENGEAGGNGTLLLNANGVANETYMWCSAFNVASVEEPFINVDGEVSYSLWGDNYVAYVRQMHDFYEEGYIFPDFLTVNFLNQSTYVVNGEINVFDAPAVMIADLNSQSSIEGFDLVGIGPAKVNADDEIHLRSGDDRARNGGDCTAISTACHNVPLALQLMNFIWSEEGTVLFNYGVEGKTFNYVDGEVVYTDLILNNPDGLSFSDACEKYLCIRCVPIYADTMAQQRAQGESVEKAVTTWAEAADTAYRISENVSLTQEENSELASILGDLSTYVAEMTVRFIIGEMDIDEDMDTYNETLISMGVERATEIQQAAVDRYLAR